MSYRRFYLCVALLLAFGNVTARAGITKLGNSASGSVYAWSYGLAASTYSGYQVFWYTATPSYVFSGYQVNDDFYPSTNPSAYSASGTFTVPVGEVWQWQENYKDTGGTWHYGSINTETGYTGSYVPAGGNKQLSWTIPGNTGPNPINWQVWNNATGAPVASVLMTPGSGPHVLTADNLPSTTVASDYTLKYWIPGLGFNAGTGNWVTVTTSATDPAAPAAPGAETVFTGTVGASGTGNVLPTGTTPAPATNIATTAPVAVPNVAITPAGTGGTIWRNAPGGSGLSDSAFYEGVDRIVDSNASQARVANGIEGAKLQGDVATSTMAAAGTTAKSSVLAAMPTAAAGTGYTVSPGTAPEMTFVLPAVMGGGTVNVNPFSAGRFGDVASWFRQAMAWLTLATLGYWVWAQMAEWVRGFSTLPQAKGNTIFAGTGGQATALLAAGLMTTAIIVGLTALLAWTFGDITLPSIAASITTNPMTGMAAGSLWILEQLFPVATILAALVARLTFNIYASAIFGGCASVIRFIVP